MDFNNDGHGKVCSKRGLNDVIERNHNSYADYSIGQENDDHGAERQKLSLNGGRSRAAATTNGHWYFML